MIRTPRLCTQVQFGVKKLREARVGIIPVAPDSTIIITMISNYNSAMCYHNTTNAT
jgi:hypothetical protein